MAEVGSEAIDPGGQADLARKSWKAAMDPEKGLLGQATGFVLGHAQQVVVYKALVFVKDASKAQGVIPLALLVLKYVESWRLRHIIPPTAIPGLTVQFNL